jgi:hypothetical protein
MSESKERKEVKREKEFLASKKTVHGVLRAVHSIKIFSFSFELMLSPRIGSDKFDGIAEYLYSRRRS